MRNKPSLVLLVGATLALLILGSMSVGWLAPHPVEAQTDGEGSSPRTITVVGEGQVSVAPDLARINLGVETLGSDVKQASSEAAATMEAMVSALETQGVADRDIQTAYYNIWLERPYAGPDVGAGSGEATYHVNNNVSVTVRNLDNLTDILGAVLDAGANTVNSIDFNVADPSGLRSEARQRAIDDALATAQELAELNGVEIGEVVSVSEVVTPGLFPVAVGAYAQGVGGGGVGPISPGEVEISTQLQVTYAIQ